MRVCSSEQWQLWFIQEMRQPFPDGSISTWVTSFWACLWLIQLTWVIRSALASPGKECGQLRILRCNMTAASIHPG